MEGMILVCVAMAVIGGAWSAPSGDEVKQLPGLMKQPSWRQYSGYLKASGTRKLHYWFVESESDPVNDPVVLWLNGGPGCSSMLGLLSENGPYRIMEDGETVAYNPNSWNKIANMIFLEAPAGVGFSYSDDKNYTFDDNAVSYDNYLALRDFFTMFSEFKSNDFYITGESYGGIYVPTLADRVIADEFFSSFQGFAVGNGLSDYNMNDDSLMYFMYYHGVIGESLWQDLAKTCCQNNTTRCEFSKAAEKFPMCQNLINKVQEMFGNSGLNIYNLYAKCDGGSGVWFDRQRNKVTYSYFDWHPDVLQSVTPEQLKAVRQFSSDRLRVTPPCLNYTAMIKYLNSQEVRVAIHIAPEVPAWTDCSDDVGSHYKRNYDNVGLQYLNILSRRKRVLVYNGDVDMACNFLGDEWFVDSLGYQAKGPLKPWHYTDDKGLKQVAGFFKEFGDNVNLTFVTVRGSGHMVPQDRAVPAGIMFRNFIKNMPFS